MKTTPTIPPPGFEELSPFEKLDYVQALWEHVSAKPEDVPVPDWHLKIVEERLAALQRGDTSARPWKEVKEELIDLLRKTRR
jgi:putative addiction module component (TIGR02574 family)